MKFVAIVLTALVSQSAMAAADLTLDRANMPKDQILDLCTAELNLPASASGPSISESIVSQLYGSTARFEMIQRNPGFKKGTGDYSGGYLKEVSIVKTPAYGSYKFGVYELVTVKRFQKSLAVEIETSNMNYTESAELGEGCPLMRFKSN